MPAKVSKNRLVLQVLHHKREVCYLCFTAAKGHSWTHVGSWPKSREFAIYSLIDRHLQAAPVPCFIVFRVFMCCLLLLAAAPAPSGHQRQQQSLSVFLRSPLGAAASTATDTQNEKRLAGARCAKGPCCHRALFKPWNVQDKWSWERIITALGWPTPNPDLKLFC